MSSVSLKNSEMPHGSSEKPAIVLLLAVWGKSYIEQFFNFSLHTLLAPGNIPALCEDYSCTFLFLTTESDIPYFKAQPAYAALELYCKIDFIEISDLIFEGNYSATLTLAYERGMRSAGSKLCSTYFFFLVSDYIFADGCFRNLIRYLKAGYNGITTGNFLVVEEYISKLFKERLERGSGVLALNPRELLELAFPYLHPVSIGQTVTQGFTHATHANRLFWKVNDHIMIGRFYLRHMLCIKPEVDNYVIGASCDYSFIPAMCPSGNIKHIQDSDDYCVIEMAPFDYEERWIQSGPFQIKNLAGQLAQWTTAVHRANAHFPIIYHSKELKELPQEALAASAAFIEEIEKEFKTPPQTIHGHYYWISCIDSIFKWILKQKNKSRYLYRGMFAGILGSPTFSPIFGGITNDRYFLKIPQGYAAIALAKRGRKRRLKEQLTGVSPQTSFWHLHWLDDFRMRKQVKEKLAEQATCVVIAFEPILEIVEWLDREFPNQCTYQFFDLFMIRPASELEPLFNQRRHVLIYLSDDRFCDLGAAIRNCNKYLPPGGEISVFVRQKKLLINAELKKHASICMADLVNLPFISHKIEMHCNISRLYLHRLYERSVEKSFGPKKHMMTRINGFVGLSVIGFGSFVGNVLSLLGVTSKKNSTSATLLFKKK